jgi:hypothetical protein
VETWRATHKRKGKDDKGSGAGATVMDKQLADSRKRKELAKQEAFEDRLLQAHSPPPPSRAMPFHAVLQQLRLPVYLAPGRCTSNRVSRSADMTAD